MIVMTDATYAGSDALIVIRADVNLDSRDRIDTGDDLSHVFDLHINSSVICARNIYI